MGIWSFRTNFFFPGLRRFSYNAEFIYRSQHIVPQRFIIMMRGVHGNMKIMCFVQFGECRLSVRRHSVRRYIPSFMLVSMA